MLRILLPLLALASVPWTALTWWRVRQARSERERNFVRRTHGSVAMLVLAAVVAFGVLPGIARLIAIPIFAVVGMAVRHGIRKGRERLRAEASDPLAGLKQAGSNFRR